MATVIMNTVKDFRETISKNGVPWPLGSATVELRLRRPDGAVLALPATVVDAAGGEVSAVTLAAGLDRPGNWTYWWVIADGADADCTDPVGLLVLPLPAVTP